MVARLPLNTATLPPADTRVPERFPPGPPPTGFPLFISDCAGLERTVSTWYLLSDAVITWPLTVAPCGDWKGTPAGIVTVTFVAVSSVPTTEMKAPHGEREIPSLEPAMASPVTAMYSVSRAFDGKSSEASLENASAVLLSGLNW